MNPLLYLLATQNHRKRFKTTAAETQNVLCGFWFEWEPHVDLADIPEAYNIVCVAFMEENHIPTLKPKFYTAEHLIDGIRKLRERGRKVLISIGGASASIALHEVDKSAFKAELVDVIETYGFSGVDLDLEGDSVKAADNRTVIPAVLREIKDEYRANGKDLMITMAPEFPDLRGYDAPYKPYLEDLAGYYDLIFPQYYNQGADGIWSDEHRLYLSQNDDENKGLFLLTLTRALVTGTQDFLKIPADKFAIGLPASPVAAMNGYVQNPDDVAWALAQLSAEGYPIRGLMTWSINHDAANGYAFANRYAPMLF